MTTALLVAFVLAVFRISVPYVLAAVGGTLSERAGVVALGLEGMLLTGAFCAAVGAEAGGPAVGALAGAMGGAGVGVILAACVVYGRADGVVVGVAINLIALGGTRVAMQYVWQSASSSPTIPGLSGGWAGAAGLAALAVSGVAAAALTRTAWGLRVRAVGEHPAAATSLGIDVAQLRFGAVALSGALAGLGGAWLALDNHGFVDRMSGGRGYIALAAVIMGRWHPGFAALAAVCFAATEAAQLQLQAVVSGGAREFIQMLPYLLTLVALAGVLGRSRPPAALGRNV